MNKTQAQALAAHLYRNAPGAAVTIQQDQSVTSESYHIEVHKRNVVRLCIQSEHQWNERKHLLNKWDRQSQ